MLVLSRKSTERIQIGDNVVVTVLEIRGNKVRIGIDAPKEVHVLRSELKEVLPSVPSDVGPGVPDLAIASIEETLPDAIQN
jgi:carbon storage regulator